MAIGIMGTKTIAVIDPKTDVDIYYNYRPTRNSIDNEFGEGYVKHPNPSDMLEPTNVQNTSISTPSSLLGGMYNLNLPLTLFSNKGIYTILITPKEIFGTILDSPAVLTVYPDIRGIVIKPSEFNNQLPSENQGLVGWKVTYLDGNNEKTSDFKIITSNGLVEPVMANISNSNQKSVSYRYNDSGNLMFLTVSPSSAPIVKPNAFPAIGSVNQNILLSNTKFNPIMIEVELTDTDINTVTDLLSGDQALNNDNGVLTTYNSNKDIINQVELIQKKDSLGKPLYELRRNKNNVIDRTQTHENTFSGV